MEIAWHYGGTCRVLAAAGKLIGANDLWIAAAALAHCHDVVSNNHDDFRRIPGLIVEGF